MSLPFRIHNNTIFAPGTGFVLVSGTIYRTDGTVATRSLDTFAGSTLELNGVDVGGVNNIPNGFQVVPGSAGWSFIAFNNPFVSGMPVSRVSTGSDGSDNQAASGAPSNNYAGTYGAAITIIELFTDELHAEFDVTGAGKRVEVQFGDGVSNANFLIGGLYDIVNFTFNVPTSPVVVGDNIQVTATASLDQVTSLKMMFEDPSNPGQYLTTTIPASAFTTQTATLIELPLDISYLPSGFSGVVILFGIGSGVQFSGTIKLGQFTVLIADASGLYTIVENKTNDTVYIASPSGPTTQDVKIPDPFFITGFVGG